MNVRVNLTNVVEVTIAKIVQHDPLKIPEEPYRWGTLFISANSCGSLSSEYMVNLLAR